MRIKTEFRIEDGGEIRVAFEDEFDARIGGWPEATDALDDVSGVEVALEEAFDRYDDGTMDGVERGVLVFDDVGALKDAEDTLFENAEGRPIGSKEAEQVRDLAAALPSSYQVEQAAESSTDEAGVDP